MNNTTRKNLLLYLGAFLLPTLLMALILLGNAIYPGSSRTLLISDMREQFMPYLASLRYLGEGDNSLFFNWSRSMGGNYFGLFAYYLASPLSWITLFFELQHMPEAIYVLTLLKIGLCGLTFSVYLNRHLAKKEANPLILLFACCYALMSYNMVYSFCIMWLDGVILLPLVLLGIERLLEGTRGLLYFITITMCFLTNYYISYIVGVFSVIYLGFRIFCTRERGQGRKIRTVLLRFGIATLLGIGISMPLLFPALQDLFTGRIMSGQNAAHGFFNFSFFDVFGKLLSSQYDTLANRGGLPSLFCGTVVLGLVLYFFLPKQISLRNKIGSGVIVVFLLVSFWIVPLDKAWHCFQFPNWYPYRYAFLFSFMMLYMGYQAAELIDPKKSKVGPLIYRICCIFTVVELFLNGSNVTGGLDKENGYALRFDYENVRIPTELMVEQVEEMDDGLYRMDKDFLFSMNDSMLFDYNSLTHSSSTFNHQVDELFERLGLARYSCWNMNFGSTILTDSLFGVKYRMAEGYVQEGWVELGSVDWYKLYQNPYALPMSFMANLTDENETPAWEENPFTNQSLLLSTLTGTDTVCFTDVEYTTKDDGETLTLTFTAPSAEPLYLRIFGKERELTAEEKAADDAYLATLTDVELVEEKRRRQSELIVNDSTHGAWHTPRGNCNKYLGTFTPGEEVVIEIVHKGRYIVNNCYLAQLDTDIMTDALQQLSSGGIDITAHENGGFTGTVTAAENQILFTSVPYDKGYTVKVDGREVEYGCFADTFLTIPLEPGTHEITLSYRPVGLVAGCVMGSIALLLILVYFLVYPALANRRSHPKEQ